jgi:N-methylhydantoinase A/oxoprolinase/acetone carboxylase beta subunit
MREARFAARDALPMGVAIEGPLVVEEATATTYIPSGWRIRVTPAGHIDATRA